VLSSLLLLLLLLLLKLENAQDP